MLFFVVVATGGRDDGEVGGKRVCMSYEFVPLQLCRPATFSRMSASSLTY